MAAPLDWTPSFSRFFSRFPILNLWYPNHHQGKLLHPRLYPVIIHPPSRCQHYARHHCQLHNCHITTTIATTCCSLFSIDITFSTTFKWTQGFFFWARVVSSAWACVGSRFVLVVRWVVGCQQCPAAMSYTFSFADGTSTSAEEGVEEAAAPAIALGPAEECTNVWA